MYTFDLSRTEGWKIESEKGVLVVDNIVTAYDSSWRTISSVVCESLFWSWQVCKRKRSRLEKCGGEVYLGRWERKAWKQERLETEDENSGLAIHTVYYGLWKKADKVLIWAFRVTDTNA